MRQYHVNLGQEFLKIDMYVNANLELLKILFLGSYFFMAYTQISCIFIAKLFDHSGKYFWLESRCIKDFWEERWLAVKRDHQMPFSLGQHTIIVSQFHFHLANTLCNFHSVNIRWFSLCPHVMQFSLGQHAMPFSHRQLTIPFSLCRQAMQLSLGQYKMPFLLSQQTIPFSLGEHLMQFSLRQCVRYNFHLANMQFHFQSGNMWCNFCYANTQCNFSSANVRCHFHSANKRWYFHSPILDEIFLRPSHDAIIGKGANKGYIELNLRCI